MSLNIIILIHIAIVVKPKPKLLLWPIKKDGDNQVNQSKLKAITRSLHKARENVHARATIGFGFTSDWLKKKSGAITLNQSLSEEIKKRKRFVNYFRHLIENRSKWRSSYYSFVQETW